MCSFNNPEMETLLLITNNFVCNDLLHCIDNRISLIKDVIEDDKNIGKLSLKIMRTQVIDHFIDNLSEYYIHINNVHDILRKDMISKVQYDVFNYDKFCNYKIN